MYILIFTRLTGGTEEALFLVGTYDTKDEAQEAMRNEWKNRINNMDWDADWSYFEDVQAFCGTKDMYDTCRYFIVDTDHPYGFACDTKCDHDALYEKNRRMNLRSLLDDDSSLLTINKFTDLNQVTANQLWDRFDCHYNCVDTLPCYVSDDWTLIVSPAHDILMGVRDECKDWMHCWGFEWDVFTKYGDNIDCLSAYGFDSPWQAFRAAIEMRDEYLYGIE